MSYNAALQALTTLTNMVNRDNELKVQREGAQLDRELRKDMQWNEAAIQQFTQSQTNTDKLYSESVELGLSKELIEGFDAIDRTKGATAITERNLQNIGEAIKDERNLQNLISESMAVYKRAQKDHKVLAGEDMIVSGEELKTSNLWENAAYQAGINSMQPGAMDLVGLEQAQANVYLTESKTSNVDESTIGMDITNEQARSTLEENIDQNKTEGEILDQELDIKKQELEIKKEVAKQSKFQTEIVEDNRDVSDIDKKEYETSEAKDRREGAKNAALLSAELDNQKKAMENRFTSETIDNRISTTNVDLEEEAKRTKIKTNVDKKNYEMLSTAHAIASEQHLQAQTKTESDALMLTQLQKSIETQNILADVEKTEAADKNLGSLIAGTNQKLIQYGAKAFSHIGVIDKKGLMNPIFLEMLEKDGVVDVDWIKEKMDDNVYMKRIQGQMQELVMSKATATGEAAINDYEFTADTMIDLYDKYQSFKEYYETFKPRITDIKNRLQESGIKKVQGIPVEEASNMDLAYYWLEVSNDTSPSAFNKDHLDAIAWHKTGLFNKESLLALSGMKVARSQKNKAFKLRMTLLNNQANSLGSSMNYLPE